MNKSMILVAFLVVALVAAPALAESDEPITPPSSIGEASADDPGTALPEAFQEDTALEAPPEPPPTEPPPTEPTTLEAPPVDEVPVPGDDIDDNTNAGPGPDDNTSLGSGPDDVVTSTGTGDADGTDDGTTEDTGKDVKKDAVEDEAVDTDDVDAEDRADRIADRILADLKDGKKDKDEDEEDKDKDDANKDSVEQNQDQDADSGDANQDADVINTGDNVNQCVGILQVANTGNAQNATGITQFDSETDEIELENGSQITLTPQLVVDCRQLILQIVRGERPNESKISKAKLREVIQPRSGAAQAARTGGVPNQVSGIPGRVSAGAAVPTSRLGAAAAPKVLSASRAGQPKTASLRRSLPRTGGFSGYATLLGLGAGTLLVGGGLLLRRLSR